MKDVLQVLPNSHAKSESTLVLEAPASLRLWHLASLDAPTVALAWSLAFAWVARVRLPLWVPALLALAVWSIYIADRLLDARTALRNQTHHRLRDRHHFHWRNRRILLPLAAASAAAAACIIFAFMPVVARERNSVLAAASLVYFTRVHTGRRHSTFLSKELLVALLFTAGCALPAFSRATFDARNQLWPLLIPTIFFALLAWLNCHAIDRWEAFTTTRSRQTVLPSAILLALAGLLLASLLSSANPRSAALLATGASAALLLALLNKLRDRLTPVALRTAADLVLLTPILLIPFAPLLK
jgi:hypothetical protein